MLFIAGYSAAAALRNGASDTESPRLGKPCTPAELGRKLRQVLQDA